MALLLLRSAATPGSVRAAPDTAPRASPHSSRRRVACRVSAHQQQHQQVQPTQQQQQQQPPQHHHAAAAWQPPSAETSHAAAVLAALLLSFPPAAHALPAAQLEELRQAINADFQQRQYYVTGNLTKSLYAPDCRFKDPTTDVKGVEPYTRAVAALFDPSASRADLISSSVSGPNSITLRWRLEGRLKIGNLPIKPYTGTTVYSLAEDSGRITGHTETWDISALDAFASTLLPGFGAPPAPAVEQLRQQQQWREW